MSTCKTKSNLFWTCVLMVFDLPSSPHHTSIRYTGPIQKSNQLTPQTLCCSCHQSKIVWIQRWGARIAASCFDGIPMNCTWFRRGRTKALAAPPTAIAAAAPTAIARGSAGLMNTVAASLLARSKAAGIMTEVSKAAPLPDFGGGLNSGETRPVTWFVIAIGSLGLHPGVLVLLLRGPKRPRPTFAGAAETTVTRSPSWAGMSADSVAQRWVRATPFGART